MQQFEKGLIRNTRPHRQPPGTVPFAKNGIRILNINQNEPGFLPSSAVIPYTPIGVIETDKFPVIFSTDNTNSAIGFFDADQDVYTPIFNDATAAYKLGFNINHPITGQSQRNYKGELILAFTDNNTFPKYLNCDTPVIASLDDWRLFARASTPTLVTTTADGGTLVPGAYYILGKVLKNDGTESSWLVISDVVLIQGTENINTGKAIEATFTDLDPDFNLIQVAIISKIAGVISQVTLEPVSIGTGNKATVIYTGANITTAVTLEELLVEPAVYAKVKTIGQLNDALYLMELEKEPEPKLQKYMLMAVIEWVSSLISVSPKDSDHASGKKRSFMHHEVYALYIRLSKTGGAGWTPLYHIPGQPAVPSDFLPSSDAAYGGVTAKVFQVEDTIRTFDPVGKSGVCGTWVNQDETYPDTDDYDASSIGGPNLRGLPVQHHRMPSIRWCKDHMYNNDLDYGKNKLDLLGIKVSNIIIPQQYASQLDGGYEIYYAKRTPGSSTVIAQSTLLYASRHGSGDGSRTITGPDTDYKTTGGNWHSQVDWDGGSREHPLVVDMRLFRFHAFDLLFNQPAINPAYMRQELLLHRANLPMIEDFTLTGGKRDAAIIYLADYIQDGSPPVISNSGAVMRRIESNTADRSQYAPANLATGKWYNIMAETAFVGKLSGPDTLDGSDIAYSNLFTGPNAERPNEAAQFETCYLSNLMNLPPNMYQPFNAQSVVRVSARQTQQHVPLFGGDVFLCDYTFHTYGWNDYTNSTYSLDSSRDPYMGIKVVRRVLCESASNIYNRYEITGNQYSKWYPNSPLVKDDNTNYITAYDRRIDPNQFGYNKDSNALNDIITASIFNPLKEDIYQFPFRIHRGGKLNKQLKIRSWRTFLPLDYYDIQKNMGLPVHLEGLDDRLLIHCENALFYTQDKMKLEQDILAVTIGTGDLFQFEPQEAYSDKLGYAGAPQSLACVRTPAGYVFVDIDHGGVYLFKGQLKLITEGLNDFFKKYLTNREDNPFIGNGVTIGYDQKYERILLTVKNLVKPSGVKELQKTQSFIDTLTPGQSLVTDNGRLMRFLGVATDYQCSDLIPVVVDNIVESIAENTPVGTLIHTITPVSGENLSYFVISGNTGGAITIQAATGEIRLSNQASIDYETRHQLVIQAKAVSSNGLSSNFTITLNIIDVNEPPVSGDQQFTIPENSANGTQVGTVQATDPEGHSLSYAITGGNTFGTFMINASTGKITVADNTHLDFETNPLYLLQVAISDGYNTITVNVRIDVTNVDEAPPLNDDTITIYDTTPTSTVVYQFEAIDPEGQTVTYEIVNATPSGTFSLDIVTGELKLVNNSLLNPAVTPQYLITVRAIDQNNNSDTGVLTINVLADPEFLDFRPASSSCSGGCPVGYTPTSDGLYCEKLTRIAATPPTSGSPFDVAEATNGAYSDFGAIVYQRGYNQNGSGTISRWLQTDKVWRNLSANLIDGPLNRCGVQPASTVPDNEPIGFSVPIVLTESTTVFVAVAGDNKCKIAVDGVVVVDQDPTAIGNSLQAQLPQFSGQGIALAFKFWHIYEFDLQAGTRFIGLEGVNFGGPFGFGAEIYKNSIDELSAAALDPAYLANPATFPISSNHYSNLNLLFSTRSTRGGTFSSGISGGYSCPTNYAMDGTTSPPQCVLVDRIASTTRIWSATQVYSLRLNQVLATLPNQAGQTYQGIPVPYYPPVGDHVDCGGSTIVYYNTPKAASTQKNDCTQGLGSVVKYAVPGGVYTSVVSQSDADNKAQTDVNTNKQQYANTNGYCIR